MYATVTSPEGFLNLEILRLKHCIVVMVTFMAGYSIAAECASLENTGEFDTFLNRERLLQLVSMHACPMWVAFK